MQTNVNKTQIWPKTPEMKQQLTEAGYQTKECLHLLGASIGHQGRPASPEEMERTKAAELLCHRVSLLPVSMHLKRQVCQSVASTKACWGHVVNGRAPITKEENAFSQAFHKATKAAAYPGGRSSFHLKKALFLGHHCSLSMLGIHALLRATHKWASLEPRDVSWSTQHVTALSKVLRPLGWTVRDSSLALPGICQWSFGDDEGVLQSCLHHIRESWRVHLMNLWKRSKRRDAALAREHGVQCTPQLISELRKDIKHGDGHTIALLTGGMLTEAVTKQFHGGGLPTRCDCCGWDAVPSISHVLWQCPQFAYLRTASQVPPQCPMQSRLGWGHHVTTRPILNQMSAIRAAECALREKARRRRGRPPDGGGGGEGGPSPAQDDC